MNINPPTLSLTNIPHLLGDWQFADPRWLMLILLAPILALMVFALHAASARRQRLIADDEMIESLVGPARRWHLVARSILITFIVAFILLAIARPQSDPREIEVESKGRDVVFIVDVSRSMLAKDVAPNRLEKSKLWINDLVDVLGNDRVGLVAFAGSSSVLSPLTTDRLFFKLALEELSPDSVKVGGTNIGDALRKAMNMVFVEESQPTTTNYRDVILISDGEDQESLPIEAARLAGKDGIRIITIGIGSSKGSDVPPKNSEASSSQRVRSKLESSTLRSIASASPGGVYLEVGTGTIDMAKVYQELISSADQHTLGSSTETIYTERFMLFIAAALVCLLAEQLVPVSSRRTVSC